MLFSEDLQILQVVVLKQKPSYVCLMINKIFDLIFDIFLISNDEWIYYNYFIRLGKVVYVKKLHFSYIFYNQNISYKNSHNNQIMFFLIFFIFTKCFNNSFKQKKPLLLYIFNILKIQAKNSRSI